MSIYDASTLARGWLSVALASAKDPDRPALDRTVSIEAYREGLRLVATDSTLLLRAWVPTIEHEWEPEPPVDEAPVASAVVMDPHGRGRGLLGHALALAVAAADDDLDPVEVRVTLGPVDLVADDSLRLDGLAPVYVAVEVPDRERVRLRTYEGPYPNWRQLLGGHKAAKTTTVALDPDRLGSLAKLAKYHAGAVGWTFGGRDTRAGRDRPAHIEVIDSYPAVDGLVMPCRWDLDADAPRDEPPAEDDGGEAGA